MSLEPWIVRTALAIVALNAVNGLLFLALRWLQKGTNSAPSTTDKPVDADTPLVVDTPVDADTPAVGDTPAVADRPVAVPGRRLHVPSTNAEAGSSR